MRQKVTLLASKGDTILDLEAQAKRAEPEPCSLSLSYPLTLQSLYLGYPWTLWAYPLAIEFIPIWSLAGLLLGSSLAADSPCLAP